MNTNMTGIGLRCFSKSSCSCDMDEISLSIGRVKVERIYIQECVRITAIYNYVAQAL